MRFGKVYAGIVENPEISPTAKACYAVLACSAHGGIAQISIKLISQRLGIKERRTRQVLRELRAALAIERISKVGEPGRWRILRGMQRGVGNIVPRQYHAHSTKTLSTETQKLVSRGKPLDNPLVCVNGGRKKPSMDLIGGGFNK